MNRLTLAFASAAVVVVLILGTSLLVSSKPAGTGGGPSPTPTRMASLPATLRRVTDTLNGGLYRFRPLGEAPSLTLVATGPAGWAGYPDWAMDGPVPRRADAPDGIGIAFLSATGVFKDPCHWDAAGSHSTAQSGGVAVGPRVDDLVTALHANTYYTSTQPKPVTIDGYAGQEITLQLPDGSYDACDKDDPRDPGGHIFVFTGGPGLYAQGPANRWHVYALDVAGKRLIAVVLSYAGTPKADVDTAEKIIATLQITP